MGLVIIGAMLGLIIGGLWLHAHRKDPSHAAVPFTLGADPQLEGAATLRDEPPSAPRRPQHD